MVHIIHLELYSGDDCWLTCKLQELFSPLDNELDNAWQLNFACVGIIWKKLAYGHYFLASFSFFSFIFSSNDQMPFRSIHLHDCSQTCGFLFERKKQTNKKKNKKKNKNLFFLTGAHMAFL